jgi:hypothetical protein
VELAHKPWTTSGLGPRWPVAVRPRARRHARRSVMRKCYSSPVVAVRGGSGRGGCGDAGGALTGDGAAVMRSGDSGKAAAMKACGGGKLRR